VRSLGDERPPPTRPVRRIRQIRDAPLHVLGRPDERIDDSFGPRVQGSLDLCFFDGRHAYERRTSRTGGSRDHRVHCFATDRPVFAIDHDEVGAGGGHRLRRNGRRNHAHNASQDAVIPAQPLLEEHRQSVAESPSP
jgi:hypothetical protein